MVDSPVSSVTVVKTCINESIQGRMVKLQSIPSKVEEEKNIVDNKVTNYESKRKI